MFIWFIWIFNAVYLLERDAYPCGPLIRVERVRYGGRCEWHTCFSFFFFFSFSCVCRGRRGEGCSLLSSYIAPGDGGQSSDDDTLDTPMRGKVLRVLLEWF